MTDFTLKLSKAQVKSIQQSTHRLNLWVGAVRSGKSFASLLRWVDFLLNGPKGPLMMIGRTEKTVKRNIIEPLYDLLGLDAKYYSGKGELKIYGRTIYIVGASDERAEEKIRGATLAGAYIDEISLIPESCFQMVLSRLSIPGAKLFGTTNPDSPFHWIKSKFIDRRNNIDLGLWEFNLDDNPVLTTDYKDSLRKEYQGLWYQRFIEGKWVLAEGTVFDFFDEKIHCIDYPTSTKGTYYIGIDYGTSNPTAFVLIGHDKDSYPNLWVEKEYYWDPSKTQRQKTDAEFVKDLADFITGYPIRNIYIDPAAASFKVEMNRSGIRNVMDADNDVLNGIRHMSVLLSTGTLKICRSCQNLIKEIQTYVWDAKAQERGIDKPVKSRDHATDATRYLLMSLKGTLSRSMDLESYRDLKSKHLGPQTLGEIDGQFRW